jgi:hypothetical protein
LVGRYQAFGAQVPDPVAVQIVRQEAIGRGGRRCGRERASGHRLGAGLPRELGFDAVDLRLQVPRLPLKIHELPSQVAAIPARPRVCRRGARESERCSKDDDCQRCSLHI